MINETIDMLVKHFQLKPLGFPSKFIRIQIKKVTENSFLLHQKDAVEEILKEYEFDRDFHRNTTMKAFKNQVVQANDSFPKYPIRKIIGSLLYLANTTRLDISFPVSYIARHRVNPKPIHYKLFSQVLSYLNCHKRTGLQFKRNSDIHSIIELYADADYAADNSRASTTGFLIRYHGSVIGWASRLQTSIAESSTEAELRALTDGAREAVFLVRMQEELTGITEFPICAHEDNKATFQNCVANVSKGILKHVEMICFKVKEYQEKVIIDLRLVGTHEQLTDILTKPLEESLYAPIRRQVMHDAD